MTHHIAKSHAALSVSTGNKQNTPFVEYPCMISEYLHDDKLVALSLSKLHSFILIKVIQHLIVVPITLSINSQSSGSLSTALPSITVICVLCDDY